MNAWELLSALEQDDGPADILDIYRVLELCGYVRYAYKAEHTFVFDHPEWLPPLTFSMNAKALPVQHTKDLLSSLRRNLEKSKIP